VEYEEVTGAGENLGRQTRTLGGISTGQQPCEWAEKFLRGKLILECGLVTGNGGKMNRNRATPAKPEVETQQMNKRIDTRPTEAGGVRSTDRGVLLRRQQNQARKNPNPTLQIWRANEKRIGRRAQATGGTDSGSAPKQKSRPNLMKTNAKRRTRNSGLAHEQKSTQRKMENKNHIFIDIKRFTYNYGGYRSPFLIY
jgi:hypothetical protein